MDTEISPTLHLKVKMQRKMIVKRWAWMSFWQITFDNDVTGVEYRKDRRLPQALITYIMEKQLLINFFFLFFFSITSTNKRTLTAFESLAKHYTIKNIEMRYGQHVYFHIKEPMYTLAMLYGPMLIISHQRSSSVEFNHRTSIKHANVFIRFVFFLFLSSLLPIIMIGW
jgi:hypothetical protein